MSKILQAKEGQFLITFPQEIAKALGVKKGDKVEFLIEHEGNFQGKSQEVRVVLLQIRRLEHGKKAV